jgi:hypothetical protein
VRHYCRHCRTRLKAPVESDRHGFCARGCHSSFYRSRCLVCEEPLRRKNERQRFGSGHAVCAAEYKRFPRVYDLPRYPSSPASTTASRSADKAGLKTGDKRERRWRQIAGPKLSERELRLATIDPPAAALIDGPPSDRFMNLVAAARKGPNRECRCEHCEAVRIGYSDQPITDAELAVARIRTIPAAPIVSDDPFDIPTFVDRTPKRAEAA